MIRMVLLAVLAAVLAVPAQAQKQDMTLLSMKIYESDSTLTPKDQRRYVSLLPKSSTRFVYWEMTVRNHLYNVREHSHSVVARWYNAANVKIGETRQVFKVQAGWSNAWVAHGRGSNQPGLWAPGRYRVDILVDGVVFTRRNFLIYDDAKVDPENQSFEVTRVRLYEGGFQPPPPAERQYTTRFNKATTRYIYAEIAGRNLFYQQRDQYPIVIVRFFKADGAYAGELIVNKAIVRSSWRSALLTSGWGTRAGNSWKPGTYRAEVWLGDTKKVGQTQFTVYAGDAPPGTPDPNPENRPEPRTTPPEDNPTDRPPVAPKTAPTPPKDLDQLEKL
ncbi:MAG: hypothetical protein RLT05_22730 [Bauldia litoralis]